MSAEPMAGPTTGPTNELITLDELTERVGISVRNVRFYTTRGLIPAPIKRGRSGYYTPDHVARLGLVKELQAHGFTLAAIETYLSRIPGDASPEEIAVHRVTLQPWLVEDTVVVGKAQLEKRTGRPLTDDDVAKLGAAGVLTPESGGKYLLRPSQLGSALPLLDIDVSLEMLVACRDIYARHGRAVAEELLGVFQRLVWPAYRDGDLPAEQLVRMLEAFQPTSVAALVEAFTHAMTEVRREAAAKRVR
ncbi:MAG: MerR family transcriptional regulator [Nocardioidaceae bacterium]